MVTTVTIREEGDTCNDWPLSIHSDWVKDGLDIRTVAAVGHPQILLE